jgi:hypothetical protein
MNLWTMGVSTLVVLTVVLVAIAVRSATEYSPGSSARLWITRIAVAAIILWFAAGLIEHIRLERSWYVVLSRSFVRGVIAILIVWFAFRDEL